jgi:hypothetical protein
VKFNQLRRGTGAASVFLLLCFLVPGARSESAVSTIVADAPTTQDEALKRAGDTTPEGAASLGSAIYMPFADVSATRRSLVAVPARHSNDSGPDLSMSLVGALSGIVALGCLLRRL